MSSVKVLRLRSGEDVLTQYKDNGNGTVELKVPQCLLLQPVGPGKMSFNFIPFFPFVGKKSITLKKDFIVIDEDPDPELLNAYNTNFGSGLTIADASALSDLAGKRFM